MIRSGGGEPKLPKVSAPGDVKKEKTLKAFIEGKKRGVIGMISPSHGEQAARHQRLIRIPGRMPKGKELLKRSESL